MTGVLGLLKPPGPSSAEMVRRIRSLTGCRRVGHAGTLDPAAAGVLPVCLEGATVLADYLHLPPKRYSLELVLGIVTDTGDRTGSVVERKDASHITPSQVQSVLSRFTGTFQQRTPAFSARKRDGEPLYRYARRGEVVDPGTATVTVSEWVMFGWEAVGPLRSAWCRIRCGSGTYVRALCRDIGEALGVGGTLGALVRLEAGGIAAGVCLTIEEATAEASTQGLERHLLGPGEAVGFLPALALDPAEAARVAHGIAPGQRRAGAGQLPGPVRLLDPDGRLAAIADRSVLDGVSSFRLRRVLNNPSR